MTQETKQRVQLFTAFVQHLHPRTVPSRTLRFSLSFGLGGMATTLVILLFITGLLQLLSYSPQINEAYRSIQQMYMSGGLGGFVRNCHYWAGNALVVITFLHLLRVFFTGAMTGLRRYNWLVGIGLFLLVLFSNFTGYLMPWDQLAYWAVTIFTSMLSYIPIVGESLTGLLRGGETVGPDTLATFYAIHTGILPFLFVLLLLHHFWFVRKAGGLIQPTGEGRSGTERVPTVPHLLVREAAVGFALLAVILLFSALVDAPLGGEANPGQSPNPAKAAWYFMGLQELLLHLHPVFAICVVPLLVLAFFLLLPFGKNAVLPGGVWFGGRGRSRIAVISCAAGVVLTVFAILLDNVFLNAGHIPQATWLVRGVLPTVGFCIVITVFAMVIHKIIKTSLAETIMGVMIFICSGIITLTVVGVWFRGPEMSLIW